MDQALLNDSRNRVVEFVRSQLIGPGPWGDEYNEENDEALKYINPIDRFPCGAIYPLMDGEGTDPADDSSSGSPMEEIDDDTEKTKYDTEDKKPIPRYVPPSSIGMSFYVVGKTVEFSAEFTFVRYEYDEKRRCYIRKTIGEPILKKFYSPTADLVFFDDHDSLVPDSVVDDTSARAVVDIRWRRFEQGWIVTISLCNRQEMPAFFSAQEFTRDRTEKTLFEAGFELTINKHSIGDYPRVDLSLLDEEEQEIELRYKNRIIYAIGHGTGVDWDVASKTVLVLKTDAMPATDVPSVTVDLDDSGDTAPSWHKVLQIQRLAGLPENKDEVLGEIAAFIRDYEKWIKKQVKSIDKMDDIQRAVGKRITDRMIEASRRMDIGLKTIRKDPKVLLAFSLANEAMLLQMRQGDIQKDADGDSEKYKWRPFQLAFLLTVLESTANNESDFRDIVDLIWFPTGGGKTEAYLGLIAFTIALRRLKYPQSGDGTTAIMRYTLRLLARDQFLRASRMICALEIIRRKRNDLGGTPITIGLWVGEAVSPNSYNKVIEVIKEAKEENRSPALVLDSCPWCDAKLSIDTGNYRFNESSFSFHCGNDACEFGGDSAAIPCNVVDEQLYDYPPTLLFSTVDKFARLPWDERCSAFFGRSDNRPPELIIQDELHLIAGALGTVYGLYEAALDTIIKCRGIYPKYVASTATIRDSATQIKRLYGREAAVFPPPGIESDDSYFARSAPLDQSPGRKYIGYLAPMLGRKKCLAPLAASLLCAPGFLFTGQQEEEQLLDAWWTQVVYHGSLRGVMNSQLSYDSDVRDFLRRLLHEKKQKKDDKRAVEMTEARLNPKMELLTSTNFAIRIGQIFGDLSVKYPEDGYIDAVLATNMVSVGLDVARLALMIVNGQPLTTAEYIQASSRVGRRMIPGLVFMNYYRDQARSLSHYEQFRPYHEAFYRFVEPTSVTPFTWQAREKALHAALISIVRHSGIGYAGNRMAADFRRDDDKITRALEKLYQRCESADSTHAEATRRHIERLSSQWENEAKRSAEDKQGFVYSHDRNDSSYVRLIYEEDARIRGLWPTLISMRNVEDTALYKFLGYQDE